MATKTENNPLAVVDTTKAKTPRAKCTIVSISDKPQFNNSEAKAEYRSCELETKNGKITLGKIYMKTLSQVKVGSSVDCEAEEYNGTIYLTVVGASRPTITMADLF